MIDDLKIALSYVSTDDLSDCMCAFTSATLHELMGCGVHGRIASVARSEHNRRRIERLEHDLRVKGEVVSDLTAQVKFLESSLAIARKNQCMDVLPDELNECLNVGKIAAIKLYRHRTGRGLKESKDAIETALSAAGFSTHPGPDGKHFKIA